MADELPADPPRPVPALVDTAYRLMLARAVVSVLGVVATFALRDELRRTIIREHPAYDPHKVDQVLDAALAISVVFGVALLVLYVLLARRVRAGRGWARVVTFVIAAIGVLGGLAGLSGDGPAVSKALGAVDLALDVGIIVLLTRRESSAYFSPA